MPRKVPVHGSRFDPRVRVTLRNGKPYVCSSLEDAYQASVRRGLADVTVSRDDYCWQVRATVGAQFTAQAGDLEEALRYLFGGILDSDPSGQVKAHASALLDKS